MALKKGDRVEWIQGPETKYGIVFRGGKRPFVYIDGGLTYVQGAAAGFKLSNQPLPTDEPSVMDKWTIVSYKDSGMGEETAAFQAEIALNGKVVIRSNNTGTGGPNYYDPVTSVGWEITDQLRADAKEWAKQFGYPYDFEAEDTWVEWAAREKIWGKLAVDYFKEYAGVAADMFK